MSGKQGQEKGVSDDLSLRAGIDIPNWRGINSELAPGRVPPDRLANAINVSLGDDATSITERGGQEALTTSAPAVACWDGMGDAGPYHEA